MNPNTLNPVGVKENTLNAGAKENTENAEVLH